MTEVVVRLVTWRPEQAGASARVELSIDTPARNYSVYIAGSGLQFQPGLEAGVALALLAAMRTGSDLRVEGALSATFLHGLQQYMQRFTKGFPEFNIVSVLPESILHLQDIAPTGRCASFFSGGVDSFFTLLKGRGSITDIVYIHGFDVRLDDKPRREAIDAMGMAVAEALGVRYLPVESNLGKVLQDFGLWNRHAHGLALIAVARMLAGYIDEVRIPSSYSIDEQEPWGSWLETDPLLSDERLRIVHDACEARRMDKVKRLATEPLALKYLRVCWGREDGMYNCCRCEKCIRTMTSLAILGVLKDADAFTLPLEPRRVASVCLPGPGVRIFTRENLQLLLESGLDWPELERALQTQLNRPIWWSRMRLKWRKRLKRWQRRFGLSSGASANA
jgi:hypothetical protein